MRMQYGFFIVYISFCMLEIMSFPGDIIKGW